MGLTRGHGESFAASAATYVDGKILAASRFLRTAVLRQCPSARGSVMPSKGIPPGLAKVQNRNCQKQRTIFLARLFSEVACRFFKTSFDRVS